MVRTWRRVTANEVAKWERLLADNMPVRKIARQSGRARDTVAGYLTGKCQVGRPHKSAAKSIRVPQFRCPGCGGLSDRGPCKKCCTIRRPTTEPDLARLVLELKPEHEAARLTLLERRRRGG